MTYKRKNTGKIGESIAKKFLVKQGFNVLEMNYSNPIGEIDIVALKGDVIHFIEVKTFSRETLGNSTVRGDLDVIHETDVLRPEHNVNYKKIEKLEKLVSSYCFEKGIEDVNLQIDAVAVDLLRVSGGYRANVRYFENINY